MSLISLFFEQLPYTDLSTFLIAIPITIVLLGIYLFYRFFIRDLHNIFSNKYCPHCKLRLIFKESDFEYLICPNDDCNYLIRYK